MKRYRVIVMDPAEANLQHYYQRAAEQAPRTAEQWLERFQAAVQTLSSLPERWPIAPENGNFPTPVRQMLFGKGQSVYRVLFTIVEDEIWILHIRRSTMDVATFDEMMGY